MALQGGRKFIKKLERIEKVSESVKIWGRIGFQAIDIINKRTLKGKDYRGKAFSPYSKKYQDRKKAKGGVFFSGVNLYDSGNMFASLKPKPTNRNVTLFFSKPIEAKKAFIHHKGIGKMPRREFFDLNKIEQKQLLAILSKELRKETRG